MAAAVHVCLPGRPTAICSAIPSLGCTPEIPLPVDILPRFSLPLHYTPTCHVRTCRLDLYIPQDAANQGVLVRTLKDGPGGKPSAFLVWWRNVQTVSQPTVQDINFQASTPYYRIHSPDLCQ